MLFVDPLQREAFIGVGASTTISTTPSRSASPEVAGLLRRITVEEPLTGDPEFGDPVDLVVGVLLREAVAARAVRSGEGVTRLWENHGRPARR